MTKERIALKGHVYATPRTESVEISNQGVLCASTVNPQSVGSFSLGLQKGQLG